MKEFLCILGKGLAVLLFSIMSLVALMTTIPVFFMSLEAVGIRAVGLFLLALLDLATGVLLLWMLGILADDLI